MLVIVSEVSANQFPILPIKSSNRFQMDLRYVIYGRVLWLIGIGPEPRGVRISPCSMSILMPLGNFIILAIIKTINSVYIRYSHNFSEISHHTTAIWSVFFVPDYY